MNSASQTSPSKSSGKGPIVLAFSAALGILGLAVGTWLMPIGIAVFLIAIVGWVYEYYRGHFAR